MEDPGVIINLLKNLKGNYNDVVRYCGTSKKINKICKEYSKLIFGVTYNEIVYTVALRENFPTLHHHVSLDTLLKYYKSFPKIWKELNEVAYFQELPMCRSIVSFDYFDFDGNVIDPSDPKNVKYIAPLHKAILGNNKKLTFLFFRFPTKLPTNLFMLERNEILTPYHFIELALNDIDIEDSINRNSQNFLHDKYNRKTWKKYIEDPMWKTEKYLKYYPSISLEEELKNVDETTTCDSYLVHTFEENDVTKLFQNNFNLDHPVVQISFNT